MYEPSKEVAVDEAMIKFQCRSTLKQYMPMKPIKRGIKVWVLGDSTNGYFSRFSIYTGKGEGRVGALGTHVVKKLTEDLKKKNHHVFSTTSSQVTSSWLILRRMGFTGAGQPGRTGRSSHKA